MSEHGSNDGGGGEAAKGDRLVAMTVLDKSNPPKNGHEWAGNVPETLLEGALEHFLLPDFGIVAEGKSGNTRMQQYLAKIKSGDIEMEASSSVKSEKGKPAGKK
jgi:hypothetical protein